MPHYAIIGPGALGLLWAARLSIACPVSLWGRRGWQPLTYDFLTPEQQCSRVQLKDRPEPPPAVALVTTKSYDALPALQQTLDRWGHSPRALVLFQNGITSQDEIAARFPYLPVFAATTTEGANRRNSTTLLHAGHGHTRLGLLNNAPSGTAGFRDWQNQIQQDFQQAGFQTHTEPDIRAALWDKLLVNAGINAFTVLLDCPNGKLSGDALFEEHIDGLSNELAHLSQLQGYSHTADHIQARIRAVAQSTANNISSMLQDARAGRQTEIDAINGALTHLSRQHRVSTPINDWLWQAVRNKTDRSR